MIRKIMAALAAFLIFFPLFGPVADAAQDWNQVYSRLEKMIQQGVDEYKSGDADKAKKTVNDSYYGIYENDGLETAIRTTISSKNANVTEYQYSELKKAIKNDEGLDKVQGEADKLLSLIQKDVKTLGGKGAGGGGWSSFWPAFLIMLREGMEALLVLVAIMSYLAKSGNSRYLSAVYNYAVAAVAASFATAYVFSVVLGKFTAGASRELIEGITALVAVAVLLSVSFWMGNKAHGDAWKKYIEKMMKTTLTTGRARALGFASFLAVYREGAEVILFYQALFNGATGDTHMIWAGFGSGAVALLVIFALIRKGLFHIPLKPFFQITSFLMFILAVSFAGGGVSELQEAQIIPQTVFQSSWFPNIDWLGLYPTYETVGIQAALLLGASVFVLWKRRTDS